MRVEAELRWGDDERLHVVGDVAGPSADDVHFVEGWVVDTDDTFTAADLRQMDKRSGWRLTAALGDEADTKGANNG